MSNIRQNIAQAKQYIENQIHLFVAQPNGLKLRYYQQDAVDATWDFLANKTGNGVVILPTGCHAAGTLILMHDGSTKPVECVTVGDKLMGPDSNPRTVLALARGREPMRRIVPIKGDPFIVNENHILSLARTNEGKQYASNVNGIGTDEISVKDWESKANYWKHLRKLRKVAVDFPAIENPQIDPWVMGCLIADGGFTSYGFNITKNDQEILDGVQQEMEKFGLITNKKHMENANCWKYSFARQIGTDQENCVTKILRSLDLWGGGAGDKFIPDIYKLGSKEVRLNILAGLLDGDGHLDTAGTFDYISKSRRLSEDLTFIARSLGLRAYCKPAEKFCQTGGGGTYWRVCVSGNLEIIPNRVPRKIANERKQKKNPLVTGFSVERLPEDDFYGFSLNGDHLYLTADFFVHHNTGKSLWIADICRRAMQESNGTARIFVITHSKELVQQNYEELIGLWPEAPAGIYSAGLNRRDTKSNIIFGSIQSMHKRAYDLQLCHLIIVDEAQSIPRVADTTWNRFFADVRVINPSFRIVGCTATDFRLDSGRLTEGKGRVFDSIIYEYSIVEAIEQGFLAPPVSRSGLAQINTAGVHVRAGDFASNELEAVAVDPATVEGIADEMCEVGKNRAGWILFGVGVKHCMMLRAALKRRGIDCEGVFATAPDGYDHTGGRQYDRDKFVADFKAKKIRCLVSVSALAVGFNAKHVDLVAIARPTQSVGLYIQICGRGTRPLYAPGYDLETQQGRLAAMQNGPKPNCIVLDFGGNIRRHGLLDRPNVKAPNAAGTGDMPVKVCKACGYENFIAAKECKQCGAPFEMEGSKLALVASGGAMLSIQMPPPEWVKVKDVVYYKHNKEGSPPSLKCIYQVGLNFYPEWVMIERTGWLRGKAESWWRNRSAANQNSTVPITVDEALSRVSELRQPSHIQVRPGGRDGKLMEVVGVKFE